MAEWFIVRRKRVLGAWNSEQLWSDPRSQSTLPPSPRTMPCRDSGFPHDTRNIVGTSGNVSERLPARERRTSTLWKFKEFGILFSRIETWHSRKYKAIGKGNETSTAVFVNTCTTFPKRSWSVWSYWSNLFWLMIRDFLCWSGILATFLTLWNFAAGKSPSELEFV